MAHKLVSLLLAASAMTCAANSAWAQEPADSAGTLDEIVVTARRTSENIQDIPVSVQAISGEAINKYGITQFTDVAKLTPGLQLGFASGSRGSNAEVVLRGVKWSSASGNPSIPFYLNEVTVDPNYALLSLYDVGQIEVLRGPQGTTRGAPSISGAITVTPKPVVLSEFGGYASGQLGAHGHVNVQGAVNIPIIKDKLGIRLAGLIDDSEGNRVRSLFNSADPNVNTKGARITVLWEPLDNLSVNLSYQYLRNLNRTYDQVSGTGSLGFTTPAGAAPGQTARVLPRNYNGPAIGTEDYLSVNDVRSHLKSRADYWSMNIKWDVLDHTLEYISGYQQVKFGGPQSVDLGNTLIGYDPVQDITSTGNETIIQEVRLSSNPGDKLIDYVVGAYYYHSDAQTSVYQTTTFLPGAFGAPGATFSPFVNPAAPARYVLPTFLAIPIRQVTYSFYGSATLHLGENTELTGGVRYIHDRRPTTTIIALGSGLGVTPAGAGGSCAGATVSAIYGAGYCDRVLVPPRLVGSFPFEETFTPTIYNISLSHKFTPDILGYVTVGSSYRGGVGNINVNVANASLRTAKPERPTSYEAGLKTSWADNRVRANVSVFQIDYKDQLAQFPGITYRSVIDGSLTQTSTAFYQNIDSRVRGVEAELAFEPMRNLSFGVTASYAKIESKGGPAPCNNPAVPLTAANEMNFCELPSGVTLNTAPKFSASFNGEYVVPFDNIEGYARFNVAYAGKNPNYGYLAPARSYALVDVFAGARSDDRAWEVGLYAKNLFNEKTELSRLVQAPFQPANGGLVTQFGPPGYVGVTATRPREVGVQLRYAFGSR